MAVLTADLHLDVLTSLGSRLPRARSPEEAAVAATAALVRLDVSASVSAVESDIAVILALNSPADPATEVAAGLAAGLVGLRIPLDAVESLRQPVRLRRPYLGRADAVNTLRRLTSDVALSQTLPNAAAEAQVLAVPVIAGDRVVAVLSVWGPGCSLALVPVLDVIAAMLVAAWVNPIQMVAGRSEAQPAPPPDQQLLDAIAALVSSGTIVSALQPIMRLVNNTVIGYEALARYPPVPYIGSPDKLFAAATTLNVQSSVDMACVSAALRAAADIGEADLFVNVLIGTLVDGSGISTFEKAIDESRVDPGSIVLEFSEREPVPDLVLLQRIAADLRARGFRIAVDDAGAGHASMRIIAELRPEFIKLDRSLIQAIDSDRARRALVVAMLSFSGHIGARVVAEGIETERERDTLQSLGVQFGQGWLLDRPVLTHRVEGCCDEVADPSWFARRQVSTIRTGSSPTPPPPLPVPKPGPGKPKAGKPDVARVLSETAIALQDEHDPMRILGVVAKRLAQVIPVKGMAIFKADYEDFRLVPVMSTGPDRDYILADSMSLDAGVTGWAFATGVPQNVHDASKHPLARQIPGTPNVDESLLLIPLVATKHKLGIFNCWRVGVAQFSDRDLEVASLFAHIAASAWRNAELNIELVNAATTDPLTRLHNSRWLRESGARDLARAARDGKPLSLVLIDLDHFNAVNDAHGHAIGDLLLQRLAVQYRATVRAMDAVVRLGGDEFVLLLPGCSGESALRVAESVRGVVRRMTMPDGSGLANLTASVGIATYPHDGRNVEHLLLAAQRAMYAAKHEVQKRSHRTARRKNELMVAP